MYLRQRRILFAYPYLIGRPIDRNTRIADSPQIGLESKMMAFNYKSLRIDYMEEMDQLNSCRLLPFTLLLLFLTNITSIFQSHNSFIVNTARY